MNTLTDSKKIYLSPSGADIKNGDLNSELRYNLSGLIKKDKYILYNTIRVIHAELPYSFYIVNEYNNILDLSIGRIIIPFGNYNANSFMKTLEDLTVNAFNILFNTTNGKFTFHYNSEFQILSSTTCYDLIGIKQNKQYSSSGGILECELPANFLGSKNIYIKLPNVILENYNTKTKDYITLLTIPLNVPPFGIVMYDNGTSSKNLVKNSQLDYLDIAIYDDNNNLIDFNGIEWNIVIEIETTLQVQQNLKTINEYLGELYNNQNLPQNNNN